MVVGTQSTLEAFGRLDAAFNNAIVNTSSGAGVKGFGRGVAYAASKFGVVGLSKSAALDPTPSALGSRTPR